MQKRILARRTAVLLASLALGGSACLSAYGQGSAKPTQGKGSEAKNATGGQGAGAAASSSAQEMQKSCHDFVQSFYTWYMSKAVQGNSDVALKQKKAAFSSELYKQLEDDRKAAAKSPDEVVGLDFDPFTNSQDPSPKYTVGKIVAKNGKYLADVHGVNEGKKSAKPDVVPELEYKDGHWHFVNFHYGKSEFPQNENLLSVLKELRSQREKPVK